MAAPVLIIRSPMAATDLQRPFHHPGWVFEEKGDGWRLLASKDAAGVRLVSRSGRDLTRRFPALAAAVAGLDPPTLLLDGEIAVFDRQLVSHFEWLRTRPKDDTATPPLLTACDCLYARGKAPEAGVAGAPERARGDHRRPAARAPGVPARRRRLRGVGPGARAWLRRARREGRGLSHVEGRTLSWLKVKQPHYREGELGWDPQKS